MPRDADAGSLQPDLPVPPIKKLGQVFQFQLPVEWQLLTAAQFKSMVQLFNALSKTIQQTVQASNNDAKMTVLLIFRGVISFQNLSHSDDVVLVTNQRTAAKSGGLPTPRKYRWFS